MLVISSYVSINPAAAEPGAAPPRCCLWAQLAALLTHPEQSSMALSKLQLTLGGLTVGAAAGYCLLAARQAAIPAAAARRSRGVSAAASSPGPG